MTHVFRKGDHTNIRLQRVLVDTRASIDIPYWNTFIDLGLSRTDLLPCRGPIQGFKQAEVLVTGMITIPVTLGLYAKEKIVEVNFTVVNFISSFNSILGRAALHAFQIVMSSLHQYLKFPTSEGVCMVKES